MGELATILVDTWGTHNLAAAFLSLILLIMTRLHPTPTFLLGL
jgi:hypothetical protein